MDEIDVIGYCIEKTTYKSVQREDVKKVIDNFLNGNESLVFFESGEESRNCFITYERGYIEVWDTQYARHKLNQMKVIQYEDVNKNGELMFRFYCEV